MKIVSKLTLKIPPEECIVLETHVFSFSKYNTTGFPTALKQITIPLIKH